MSREPVSGFTPEYSSMRSASRSARGTPPDGMPSNTTLGASDPSNAVFSMIWCAMRATVRPTSSALSSSVMSAEVPSPGFGIALSLIVTSFPASPCGPLKDVP